MTAGGDGSLIGIVMKAKEHGVNVEMLHICPLPYGTGNDLCRVIGWGGGPEGKHFRTLPILVNEICLKTAVKEVNVWSI